jgi:hypothetical protein
LEIFPIPSLNNFPSLFFISTIFYITGFLSFKHQLDEKACPILAAILAKGLIFWNYPKKSSI